MAKQNKGLTYLEAKRWLLQHGKVEDGIKSGSQGWDEEGTFVRLTKPLPMFKKGLHRTNAMDDYDRRDHAVINLMVPVGTLVYIGKRIYMSASTFYKMRVEHADVHSVVNLNTEKEVAKGFSRNYSKFEYKKGQRVKVRSMLCGNVFSKRYRMCETGIHGFVDIDATLNYRFD